MTMPCIVQGQPLLLGLLHARITIGLNLVAGIGGIVSCPFLVGAYKGFYSGNSCQLPLFLAVLLGASMLLGPVGFAHIVVVWLLRMKCT